ncbi:ATP-dependent helicase [Bacillus sp. FJAT-45350]|uniref:ATP-dependent helicase n=1 Tax=Bacillus sp. FJAT-45350 TaxID=2011014 RepID=UPI00211BB53E|nr:ATP-dependent helicase [Bacillus sp. FJAT-45350]
MKLLVARYRDNIINLTNCQREDFQRYYTESLNGQIHCIHCGDPLRLRLGINQAPIFIHPTTSFDCETIADAYINNIEIHSEEQTMTSNGFQLPRGRSIQSGGTAVADKTVTWVEPETITGIAPFTPVENETSYFDNPYYQKLQNHNHQLDPSQWSATTTIDGPLLVLAGAGSGKTRVLTTRTAYMLSEKQIPANRILLVTFTAKAAKEMKERMGMYPDLTSLQLRQLLVGTFHSIFYKMLMHHQPDKWQPNQLLKWDWQRDQLLKQAGREIDLDEKEFAYDQALTQIGLWKNEMKLPTDIKAGEIWEERVLHLYKRYEEMKLAANTFDFDDMLVGCYELLMENEGLLEKYQERFSYIAVDEFQDINKVQYKIIELLAGKTRNLCVVGDDDQSIYGFRGSDPSYILNFKRDYPEAKTVILDRNYRSTHPIVSAANNVICHNQSRNSKKLLALSDSVDKPILFYPYDEEEEATMIVTDIKERIEAGENPTNFAILYRTNVAARALFERFVQSNIPFTIEQEGDSFYQRKAVRKVLAYLRLGLNPDDTKAMGDLVGALFLKQSAFQDLKALSITNDCTLVEALTKLTGLKSFQEKKLKKMVPLFKKLPKLTPLDAIAFIEKEMGLSDYLKKQGNEGNVMDKGSDDVRDLKVAAKTHPTVSTFLEHVEHMIAKNKEMKDMRGQVNDGIQLMTIHRSKGLEFKHVYIIGGVDGGIPHDYALDAWRDGDDGPIEEERRLMYVAITRAEQTLKISVPNTRRGKKAYRSRFVREIGRQTSG